jgi:hypothetical protein
MNKKYELIAPTKKSIYGKELFQLKAKVSFGIVKKGELGGFVESEKNLSKDGSAWVSDDARVSGNAWVYGDAQVGGSAQVYGSAQVSGASWVGGNARVYGGWCFATRHESWNVTELPMSDGYVLLVKDYVAGEQPHDHAEGGKFCSECGEKLVTQ